MRYGLFLPAFGVFAEGDVLVEVARRAEAAGWDGVFCWDHLVADDYLVSDPWVSLGAMAAVTQRVLLGPLVTPLSRRRPQVVAAHAATLARISGGRAVLGVGVGWPGADFDAFGDEPSAAALDEGLETVRGLWQGGAVRHGRVSLDASPPGAGHRIPIWGAHLLGRDASLRRAARLDGVMPIGADGMGIPTPAEVERVVARVTELGASDGFDVVVRGNASTVWGDASIGDVGPLAAAGATWWLESLMHFDPLADSLRVIDAGPSAVPG